MQTGENESVGPVRVLLVDDDAMVREHLSRLLSANGSVEVVSAVASIDQAVEVLRSRSVDVALLDIRMPGTDGISGLPRLLEIRPQLPAAMLTTFGDDAYIRGAVAAGARGFLLKTESPADIVRAVTALHSGGAFFTPRAARWLVRAEAASRHGRDDKAAALIAALPPHQRKMLSLVAQGMSNREIASELGLATGTVKQYLSSAFAAIGAENRVQAAIMAYRIDSP